jgi:hypothetical protein
VTVSVTSASSTGVDRLGGLAANVHPLLVSGFVAPGTNQLYGSRITIPTAGTLRDLSVWIVTSSGNLQVGVYDTGQAASTTRTRLYQSGSVVMGTGTNWQVVADPALAVTAGQQLDLAVIVDNNTATLGRIPPHLGAAQSQLPTSFWPTAVTPKLAWVHAPGSFILPSTLSEANCAATQIGMFYVMGRVV